MQQVLQQVHRSKKGCAPSSVRAPPLLCGIRALLTFFDILARLLLFDIRKKVFGFYHYSYS